MVKIKTADLIGVQLDLAVAKADGLPLCNEAMQGDFIMVGFGDGDLEIFSPSTDWSHGGPIIERERIETRPSNDAPEWGARITDADSWSEGWKFGPTPLIAAMRAFVASKLGDEVEVPEVTP
ncbi:MAG: DUF2591 domain-containing protein [Armatimonadia bacterium]